MTVWELRWTPEDVAGVLEKRFYDLPNIWARAFVPPEGGYRIYVYFGDGILREKRRGASLSLLWLRHRPPTSDEVWALGLRPEERYWFLDSFCTAFGRDAMVPLFAKGPLLWPEDRPDPFMTPGAVLRAFTGLLRTTLEYKREEMLRNPVPLYLVIDFPELLYREDIREMLILHLAAM